MERAEGFYGFRARLAHLMTWLAGPVQNQQRQIMENDRQTRDGITRGNDDPDNRARQAFLSPAQPTTRMPPAEGSPARTAELSARAEALLQRLERQQAAQQHALEQSEQQARFQAQHQARQRGRG